MNQAAREALRQVGIAASIECSSDEFKKLPDGQKYCVNLPNTVKYMKYNNSISAEDASIMLQATQLKTTKTIMHIAIAFGAITAFNFIFTLISIFL